jgi:hypothetical protein
MDHNAMTFVYTGRYQGVRYLKKLRKTGYTKKDCEEVRETTQGEERSSLFDSKRAIMI